MVWPSGVDGTNITMDRKKQLVRIFVIITTVSLLALLYFFVDARYANVFPRCPLFALTGLHCPGCGSQRAISSLLHADILQALHFNVMLVASLPLVMYSACVHVLNIFRSTPLVQKIFHSPMFVKAFLVLVILFWVLRNIPVYPFNLLAPA